MDNLTEKQISKIHGALFCHAVEASRNQKLLGAEELEELEYWNHEKHERIETLRAFEDAMQLHRITGFGID